MVDISRDSDLLGKEKCILEKDKVALESEKIKYFGTKMDPIKSSIMGQMM